MPKSGRVRLSDLRRAFRLIHDCRDVGHDPAAWSPLLAEGVIALLGSRVVVVGQIDLASGPPRNIHLADRGWDAPQHRDQWYRRNVVEQDYRGQETFHRFQAVLSGLTTRSRPHLIEDAEWYRSAEFNEIYRPMGLDDLLASLSRPGTRADRPFFCLITSGALGDPPFSLRQQRLLHLFHAELASHVGRSLALDAGGPLADLPPYLRRTLECLLEGDGEKQVASRLGLSRHTVHEYVKALYRRLGVNGRAELMALCLRLRPGPAPRGINPQ